MNERNLSKLVSEIADKMIDIGIMVRKQGSIKITKRKGVFGICKRIETIMGVSPNIKTKTEYIIYIHEMLLNEKLLDGLKSTIAHELLHTVDGCFNHSQKWLDYANTINDKLGIDVIERGSFSKKGFTLENMMENETVKYITQCDKCGNFYPHFRKTKIIKYTNLYKCSCGGDVKLIKGNE